MSQASPSVLHLDAPQHMHIHHVLEDWAGRTSDAPALIASGRIPLAYGHLHRQMDDTLQSLRAPGVGCEDRVALVLPTVPEMAVAFLAVAVASSVCNHGFSASTFFASMVEFRPT